ncbi:MAG: SRPBCC family protein [Planctomycetota bacterium]
MPQTTPNITRDGKDWVLHMTQWLPLPPDQLFVFFGDAHNLEAITPDTVGFKILTPPPIDMHAGTRIDYKLRVRGLPIRWTTHIEVWDPPRRFVDNQIKGPYKRWHHTHTFEPKDGGTLCIDTVRYRPPGGPLAPLINWLAVERDVVKIFEHRTTVLEKRFGRAADNHETPGNVQLTPGG